MKCITPDRAQNYHSDSDGTRLNYDVTAKAIVSFRESGTISEDWGAEIQEDYVRRGGKNSRKSKN
ncbi:MAG: hypothetical protein PHF24_10400 [Syntrophomonas sp.]|nr:hypothetical protein [Syntrophomonas sp.]